MLHQSHDSCHGAIPEGYATCEADLFAGFVLGKGVLPIFNPEVEARAKRERLEELAPLSPRHAAELRALLEADAEAKHERELLEFAAQISTRHEAILRSIRFAEAEAREKLQSMEDFAETLRALEAGWDPIDHPRAPKGQPDGGQWVDKDGGGGASGTERSPSFLDAVIRRNQTIAGLSGVVTPGMIQSNGIATELRSAARLPGEVARWASDVGRAAAAGLGTGGKAVVNGFATAVKSVATLGLNTSQLELIGVTKEDRARGYDTAAAIGTASGQILIAVGTGGITSALSKGGSVARAASGALILYDAAGNAVGVVQGVYDATKNGVSVANGAQVAGGLLGLSANALAAKNLAPRGQAEAPNILFRVGKHG
ncbi:MAG TPA: hypothetical protein VGZ26_04365, partial [Pirellulales bacterium]|nr:hypothetical protein [Pirellulales bacterium]